jgi:hypothetical protein
MYKVLISSYKRAGKVITHNLFNKCLIVIPKSQEKDYKKYYDKEKLLTIPDDKDGNLPKKRNYLLDKFKGENLLLLDDDIRVIGYWEGNKRYDMNRVELDIMIENGFNMARELGTVFWGINCQFDKKFYKECTPFSLLSYIGGPFQAIVNTDKDIRYDEVIYLKEDYDLTLQVILKYRKVLRFNKYHYKASHVNMAGGCASYRTYKKEMGHNEMLQRKWGSKVITIERKTQNDNRTINPILRVPLKGI